MRLAYVMALLLLCLQAQAEIPWLQGGHTKLRALATQYPDDSAFHQVVGDWAYDQGADLVSIDSLVKDRGAVQVLGELALAPIGETNSEGLLDPVRREGNCRHLEGFSVRIKTRGQAPSH